MIRMDRGRIYPGDSLPKEFFEKRKFGEFYYRRISNDIDTIEDNDKILCEKENYRDVFPNNYTEDIVKTLDFLENTQYLELVVVYPINNQVLDILYKTNKMDKGVLYPDFRGMRSQVGQVETSKFDEVLSQAISDKMMSSGDKNSNNIHEKPIPGFEGKICYDFDRLEFTSIIEEHINVMKMVYNIFPNTILVPKHIYGLLFNEGTGHIKILTKSHVIHMAETSLDVWINPHSENVLLYRNNYMDSEFDRKKAKPAYLFNPFMMFGKRITNKTSFEISKPNELFNQEDDKNKYFFMYNITGVGFDMDTHFLSIYFRPIKVDQYVKGKFSILEQLGILNKSDLNPEDDHTSEFHMVNDDTTTTDVSNGMKSYIDATYPNLIKQLNNIFSENPTGPVEDKKEPVPKKETLEEMFEKLYGKEFIFKDSKDYDKNLELSNPIMKYKKVFEDLSPDYFNESFNNKITKTNYFTVGNWPLYIKIVKAISKHHPTDLNIKELVVEGNILKNKPELMPNSKLSNIFSDPIFLKIDFGENLELFKQNMDPLLDYYTKTPPISGEYTGIFLTILSENDTTSITSFPTIHQVLGLESLPFTTDGEYTNRKGIMEFIGYDKSGLPIFCAYRQMNMRYQPKMYKEGRRVRESTFGEQFNTFSDLESIDTTLQNSSLIMYTVKNRRFEFVSISFTINCKSRIINGVDDDGNLIDMLTVKNKK